MNRRVKQPSPTADTIGSILVTLGIGALAWLVLTQ